MSRSPARTDGSTAVPPKSTLFCPSCGHESRVDGDWTVQSRGDRHAYLCPECETTITERPTSSAEPEFGGPSVRAAAAFGRLVGASTALVRRSIAVGAVTVAAVRRPRS